MNALTDQQLLRDYAERHSEAAFGELVRRHLDLVYSAALRMLRDEHLTEDVAQGVFVALARNACQLTDRPVLSGWLHRTTQNLAANAIRSEVRRRNREQEAAAMNQLLSAASDASWEDIAPHLDAALGELNDSDRDALTLRYFEKKSAPEMAAILGISEEAAQKRVRRAVERLREFLARRGVAVGASGLAVVISANAVQAAPAGLAAAIATSALAGAAAVSASTFVATTKIITMTTLQKALFAVTVAALAGVTVYQARQTSELRRQIQSQQAQPASLTAQIQQLRHERDDATNRLAALAGELAQAKKQPAEVLKLRGEVGSLRQEKALAGSKSALNKITADPELRKNLRDQQKIGMTAIYSKLASDLKLSPDQTEQFNNLLADQVMDSIDLITQTLHDHNTRAEVDKLFAAQQTGFHSQLQAILGTDGMAQYDEYNRKLLSTLTTAQFTGSLTGDADAVAEKSKQLSQLVQTTVTSSLAAAGLPADYQAVPMLNFGNIASEEAGNQSLEVLDNIYGQVIAQATNFLTADELDKLQAYRTKAVSNSRTMLLMNRNLMAPISK